MLLLFHIVSEGADYFPCVSSFGLNGSCFGLQVGVSLVPSSLCGEFSGPLLKDFLGRFGAAASHIGWRMETISQNVDSALELYCF